MYGPRKSSKGGRTSAIENDKLMSKLLMRVVTEVRSQGGNATPQLMDDARAEITQAWHEHQGKLSDRDLKKIVTKTIRATKRSKSSMEEPPKIAPTHEVQQPRRAATTTPPEPSGTQTPVDQTSNNNVDLQSLLKSTTRKQREMIADAEWVKAAEEDRVNGIVMKKKERQDQVQFMAKQRSLFDQQIDEHNRQKAEEAEARRRRQQEMDEHIANHRRLTREERQAAHDKAMREKQFRDRQQKEMSEQRERQRQAEHDEQVRHYLMVQEELRRQREKEYNQKMQQKSEWKRVLHDNQAKLDEKARKKEAERDEDRAYQKAYEDNLDRIDRERAEEKARKEARATYFQQLANGVASLFMQKEQDKSAKIEAEYQEQLRRAMEDEKNRKQALKNRTLDCLRSQQDQCDQKRREREAQREEERRQAQALTEQIAETKRQEEARKRAQKAEAQRMKEFLNTQLQLQHFKETRPLETGITRPESRGQSMFSPSRYTPSPKMELSSSK